MSLGKWRYNYNNFPQRVPSCYHKRKPSVSLTQTVLFFFIAQRDLANYIMCKCKISVGDGGCIWCFSSVPKTRPGFEEEEDRRRREREEEHIGRREREEEMRRQRHIVFFFKL